MPDPVFYDCIDFSPAPIDMEWTVLDGLGAGGPFIPYQGSTTRYRRSGSTQNCNLAKQGILVSFNLESITGAKCTYVQGMLVVLPVTLLNCELIPHNNHVTMEWQTSYEYENLAMVVERSTPASNIWTAVARVDGRGNSDAFNTYPAIDQFPAQVINLYRLKDIAFTGDVDHSEIQQVFFTPRNSAYTNPMSTTLNARGAFEL